MTGHRERVVSPHIALVALYFFLASAASVNIAVHETRCSDIVEKIAEKQSLNSVTNMDVNLNPRLMGSMTSFFLRLTNPHISNAREAARTEEEIVDLIKRLRLEIADSAGTSLVLLGLTALFLMGVGRDGASDAGYAQRRIYSLLGVSLIFFALGIGLPVLTAVVKGRHMLVGGFIIQTTSKGIVSTVHTLLDSGNWIIAILLAGFSIVIPVFKGCATLAASVTPSEEKRERIGRFLETIGRWSLTDVLVAAVLLGCFSLNAISQESGGIIAVPRFAFGFFVIYCVLAARTSYLLKSIGGRAPPVTAPAIVASRAAILAGALGAGAFFGYYVFQEFTLGRKAVDSAVIKLVRAHTELLSSQGAATEGRPAQIRFELPFEGVAGIQVMADGDPMNVAVFSEASDTIGRSTAKPPPPLPGFTELHAKSYSHFGKLPAGQYTLAVASSVPRRDGRFSVHITLDP